MIIAFLIAQGIVAVLWAFTMFRTLFHLRRQGQAMTGIVLPGPLTFLRTIGAWFRDPAERRWRWRLLLLTAALILLSVAVWVVGEMTAVSE